MMRIRHLISKTKNALSTGTFGIRILRFVKTIGIRTIEVLIGYFRLTKADRRLPIKDGFVDHRKKACHIRSCPEHLARIISSYKTSKRIQSQAPPAFLIRGVWDEWISINHRKIISALQTENIENLSNLFENLFREQFTTGTGGFDNYIRYRSIMGRQYIKYVWSRYRDKLIKLDFNLQDISFPWIGNPTGIILNKQVISIETLRHAYHALEMRSLLQDIHSASIVEIGGGLGGQAYQTEKLCRQISKYVIFDIPEVAAISSYFLLSAFPEKRIRLFGEGPASIDSTENYDIAIFPHFAIAELPDLSVDLFYNSCSFSEMDRSSSMEYLSIIERSCRKYFMHVNHDTVFEFKYPDGSISKNVIGSELLPNPNLFKRVFKKPRVHCLPEDRLYVQFEYLYERMKSL
jgi:putative sugar O-methyltransferase